MQRCIAWLIALTGLLIVAGIKEHFQDDVDRLRDGGNLLYMSVGDRTFNSDSMQRIMHSHHATAAKCVNICGSQNVLEEIRNTAQETTSDGITLVVISGLEHLDRTNLRSLDFAYRLTDSSSDIASAVVLLLMEFNNAQGALQDNISKEEYDDLKLQLAETLNEDSVYFNGHAFTGRLSHIFFQQRIGNITLPGAGCASASATTGSHCSLEHYTGTAARVDKRIPTMVYDKIFSPEITTAMETYASTAAVAVAALAVLVSVLAVWCCRQQDRDDFPQSTVPKQQSVSAQIVGAGPYATGGMSYGIVPESESVPPTSWGYVPEQQETAGALQTPAAPRTQGRSGRHSADKGSGERRTRPASDSRKASKATGATQDGAGGNGGRKRHSTGTSVGHEYATRSKDHR